MSVRSAGVVAGLAFGLMSSALEAAPLTYTFDAMSLTGISYTAHGSFGLSSDGFFENVEGTITHDGRSATIRAADGEGSLNGTIDFTASGPSLLIDVSFDDNVVTNFGDLLTFTSDNVRVLLGGGEGRSIGSGVIVATLSTVPLPASAPLFGAALLGLAGLGYAAKRKKEAATA